MIKDPKELLENEVITHLLHSGEYFESVLPFLEPDYFEYNYGIIIKHIKMYHKKYSQKPNLKELILFFKESSKQEKDIIKEKAQEFQKYEPLNHDLLIDLTEKFIKRKIFEKAIITGAEALGKNSEDKFSESFKLAEESVKVSLESDLGYAFTDVDKMNFEVQKGLLTGIPSFDKILGPGFTPGTLNSAMAPSGIGKTATLIAFACEFARQKQDIVFISMEQSEVEIYKRIYANLLDVEVNLIHEVDKEVLKMKIREIEPQIGKIIVKQYPAKSISSMGISSFLDKLKHEKQIENPVLFIDYLGLLKSDFLKNMDNSYQYIGSVAEELRGLAIQRNLIVFSPMQLNRSAYGNLEAGSESLSDSMKVYHTLDSAFLILQTPEMKEQGNIKIVFTKNRFSGLTSGFEIKFDYKHFKFDDKFFINGENITEQRPSENELQGFEDKISGLIS